MARDKRVSSDDEESRIDETDGGWSADEDGGQDLDQREEVEDFDEEEEEEDEEDDEDEDDDFKRVSLDLLLSFL